LTTQEARDVLFGTIQQESLDLAREKRIDPASPLEPSADNSERVASFH
jgi:hypothetical protein